MCRIKLWLAIVVISMAGIRICRAGEQIVGLSYLDGQPVAIEINEGRISGIEKLEQLAGTQDKVYIAPGFIDNQVNGYAGVSFTFGGGTLTQEGVVKATQELWKSGVTTFFPTLTTNSHEILMKNFKVLKEATAKARLLGSIPGFHLEGPYISDKDGYRGAHPKEYVRSPDWKEFMEYYEASGGKILTVTVAPDVTGAMEFINKCTALGIVVAMGHHNASAAQVNEAVLNGARISTHLGNGCANLINRHRNPLWPQLANDQLMISIICDGFHLLPEEISTFYKVKGPELTIITSDVTGYAALPPGKYLTNEGEQIELTPEGMLRYPSQNVLYGSASPITRGVGHIMKTTGCSLAEAVRMASTNPARLYGLEDRGTLEPGKRADLILFSIVDGHVEIKQTYVRGELVYDSSW